MLARRWRELAVFPAPFDRRDAAAIWGTLGPLPEDVEAWPELTPLDEETRGRR